MKHSEPRRPDDVCEVRSAALRLLAGREHSRNELTVKLVRRGFGHATVEAALDELCGRGLQSDARYAEGYARGRAQRAYGPVRIRAELAERGVDRDLICAALDGLELDFSALARDFCLRRFGSLDDLEEQERARRARALARRGFATEHLRWLLVR